MYSCWNIKTTRLSIYNLTTNLTFQCLLMPLQKKRKVVVE